MNATWNAIRPFLVLGSMAGALLAVDPATSFAQPTSTVYCDDFEGGWGNWWADNGIWEIGLASAGPAEPPSPVQCAGTALDGSYDGYTDSRLISPQILFPELAGDDRLKLKFWQWHSYSSYDDGRLQIQERQADGSWGTWTTLNTIVDVSGVWTQVHIDLSAYAGSTVRLAFYHTADRRYGVASESTGWYLDDVCIVAEPVTRSDHELFESGVGDWWATNGLWQIGAPTAGPGSGHESSQCAGTVLGGNYPGYTDSRLVSPEMDLALLGRGASDRIKLKFWQWHSHSSFDDGRLQIQQKQEDGTWGSWTTLNTIVDVSGVWTQVHKDLTEYAGSTIRLAFYHTASRQYGVASESRGWYVDDVSIVAEPILVRNPATFEEGNGDWWATNGLWQIGVPTSGPSSGHESSQCAGTVLGGNYPGYTDSRLVSPEMDLVTLGLGASDRIKLKFWQWHSHSSFDDGRLQIQERQEDGTWGGWTTLNTIVDVSGVWTQVHIDLTEYAASTIRLAFYHTASRQYGVASESRGWYVDDVAIVVEPTVIRNMDTFELGQGDWWATNGLWQIGVPSVGPASTHSGVQCAGTILSGNYPGYTDSRLVSAPIQLDPLTDCGNVGLFFWHWRQLSSYETARVQISVDSGAWEDLPVSFTGSSPQWTQVFVDLSGYCHSEVRIAFFHTATRRYGVASESTGWYVDDVRFVGVNPPDDTVAPAEVDPFAAQGGLGRIRLTWTNPLDSDLYGVFVRYSTDEFPLSRSAGLPVPNGGASSIEGFFPGNPGQGLLTMHEDLDEETTYYYSAWAMDGNGNESSAAQVSLRTRRDPDHEVEPNFYSLIQPGPEGKVLDLYVRADDDIVATSLAVEAQGAPVALATVDGELWHGTIEAPKSGADVWFSVRGVDRSGTEVEQTKVLRAQRVASDAGGTVRSPDGVVAVHFAPKSLRQDELVLVAPAGAVDPILAAAVPEGTRGGTAISADAAPDEAYSIGFGGLRDHESVTLTFSFDPSVDPLIEHVGRGHVPSETDVSRGTVSGAITGGGTYRVTGDGGTVSAPMIGRGRVVVAQNRPNPFRRSTEIFFEISRAQRISVDVFDVRGRLISRVRDGVLEAGRHAVTWDARDSFGKRAAPGVYFYRVEAEEGSETKKMLLLR